ncbi:MAG: hypothetical protein ABJ263_18410 [Tateyamaria sp.]|uniref:hypothetical protein n=1 Tax=Tateyamaria sp. TaxID=1929288 RepID=UPI00326A44A7
MSDHSHTNLHRSDGTSGRGLLIAFGLIVAFILLIAFVGSFAGGDGGAADSAITPAGEGIIAPEIEPAPVPTE